MNHKFAKYSANPNHPNWEALTARADSLYHKDGDIRSPFARDYTRILHSMAYRRLKHKTQVFFNIDNDHICTRMEHVSHVASVSGTIAKELGLNEELTRAISIGHDLGHAPFGHQGEQVLNKLAQKYLGKPFWHERNGLHFVDNVELLEDPRRIRRNLDLTYAVRDGILSHCGEVDQNGLFPRDISIPLEDFDTAGKYEAATWEGCVVKLADKISYLGRDIEDALSLGFLSEADQRQLQDMARKSAQDALSTTVIIHNLIIDVCRHSSPEVGITLSPEAFNSMTELKEFNTQKIYHHPRLEPYRCYSELIINRIFDTLLKCCDGENTWSILKKKGKYMPQLCGTFGCWLCCFCTSDILPEGEWKEEAARCKNRKIYGNLDSMQIRAQAVIDFISGMTDRFAVSMFQEMLSY